MADDRVASVEVAVSAETHRRRRRRHRHRAAFAFVVDAAHAAPASRRPDALHARLPPRLAHAGPNPRRDAVALGAAGSRHVVAEGGVARTLVELAAEGVTQAWALAAAVARGALLSSTRRGDWLTELARSHFAVDRAPATFAVGYVRLTGGAGRGPYTVAAAALVVSDGTRYYRSTNATSVTVPAGSYVDVPVRAEGAGAACNQPR